jgi:hypothetical protein
VNSIFDTLMADFVFFKTFVNTPLARARDDEEEVSPPHLKSAPLLHPQLVGPSSIVARNHPIFRKDLPHPDLRCTAATITLFFSSIIVARTTLSQV